MRECEQDTPAKGRRRRRPDGSPEAFDPREHAPELGALIEAVAAAPALDARALERIVRRHPRRDAGLFSKSQIIKGFRAFGGARTRMSEAAFVARTVSVPSPLIVPA